MRTNRVFTLALLVSLAGCGGGPSGAFTPLFPDNEGPTLSRVLTRMQAAPASPSTPLAAALGPEGLRLYDLAAGRTLWTQPVSEPRTAPQLAGELVVLHEAGEIIARRVESGAVAFRLPDAQLSLVGAAGEGSLSVIVLSTTGGVGAASHVILARGGAITHNLELEGSVGAPAVRGGLAFVPWGSQNVSVLDGETAIEIARLRSTAGVVSHVRADPNGLVFGQAGAGRFVSTSTGDADSVGWFQPDASRLPGTPPLWRSAYDPPASATSATHKIQLVFAAGAGEGAMTFTDDSLYLTFYRFVFALNPADLSVRWVHAHDTDVVGAAAFEGGVFVADAAGGLTSLGPDGMPRSTASLDMQPSVVALQLGSFTPSGSAVGAAPSVGEQLAAAAENTDARLVPARLFAVSALSVLEGADVTARLIGLCDNNALPGPVQEEACAAVSTRADGAEPMLAALSRQASFLEGTTVPPVGALAQLAATLGEQRAVAPLIEHLEHPSTPTAALVPLADALSALGDDSALPALRAFLWLYHTEPADDELAQGMGAVARAVVHLDDDEGVALVQSVADAPFTDATSQGALNEVLNEAAEQAAAEEAAAAQAAAEAAAAEEEAGDGAEEE
ncbi:MAG: PQQ-binding-like beta-propeller repeat protein [Sandaracinaceae bacterium]